MARKKRKFGKNPAISATPATRADAWLLPALGALALMAGWLAFLGALSGGHLNWNAMLETDTLRPYLLFRDLTNGLPLSGWPQPGAWMWFPDYAILWTLFALGAEAVAGALLFPIVLAVFSSVGWILACEFLFGKSPLRRAFVLVLHALPLLIVAWRGLDVFFHQMVPVYRGGLWSTTPWMLWLALRALDAADARARIVSLAALALALAVLVAGDLIVIAWLSAPLLAAALGVAVVGKLSWRDALISVAALGAATIVGRYLNANTGDALTGRNFALAAEVARVMGLLVKKLAARNPLETIVWTAFAALAAARLWTALFPGERGRKTSDFWTVGPGRRRLFVALYVPAAMLLPVVATLTQTMFGERLDPGKFHTSSYRYFMPLFYFALFSGWALLPWRDLGGVFTRAPRRTLAAAVAAVLLLAAPRAADIRANGLNMFASPFHQCYAENARRLGWKGGIANWWAMSSLDANPDVGLERILHALVPRHRDKPTEMTFGFLGHKERFSGEFQFVGVNLFRGRVFLTTPAAGEPGCPAERASECVWPGHYNEILDEAAVIAEFGEPAEIVDCHGYGFFHYDPPLRFDFSELDLKFPPDQDLRLSHWRR